MTNHTYKLGDRILLQKDGGPIGLEATGAISRAYMMHYDRLYLEAVERSAHSSGSKRSVHISELVRRILNTSRRLDWSTSVALVLEKYMRRMMAGGYSEKYREDVLRNATARLQESREGNVHWKGTLGALLSVLR